MKKNRKIFYTGACFALFLFAGFYFFTSKIFAQGLELQYPTITIGGKSASAGTDFPSYIIYLYFAGIAIGFFSVFLSLIIAGVMYILSPIDPGSELLSRAKDRISGAISGLLILALIYLILSTINPQLNVFNLGQLQRIPPPPPSKQDPGVYFYVSGGCSDDPAPQANVLSVPDLGDLKDRMHSVNIVEGDDDYITIIYDTINFQGECGYIANQGCQNVSPFANSASVYIHDSGYSGGGVSFFRKSNFNSRGGEYDVDGSQIGSGYVLELAKAQFQDVPKEEQDCIKYDDNGECNQNGRQAPNLGGENISSVKINGNYLVLFVYKGPNDNGSGPWTSCEEFPTPGDINKTGPEQIKWDVIRNKGGVLPNYVAIIPIKTN